MYLLVSEVGYYLGFSRAAVEERCKILRSKPSDVIDCFDIKEVKWHIAFYLHKKLVRDVEFEKLVYWPEKISLVDLKAQITYLCFSDGTVWAHTKDGKSISYKICQDYSPDNKKSVKLLEKRGELLFYNFEERKVMKLTAKGEVYRKTEYGMKWEKVSGSSKVSKP